jgi:putative nucleotidyltransferase with HDIG domain
MLNVENFDKNFAHHGVTVSTFAVTLAKKVAKFDDKQMELLAIGALLHDFGHSLQPINLNQKIADMSAEEQNLWHTHTLVGAKAARERNLFDKTVIHIINQHEEKVDGSGPLGLDLKKQDPLATIVASANKADRLLTFEGYSRAEVIKKLVVEETTSHPFPHMQCLAEMIKKL